jgi:hypothetical protein
MRYSPHRYRTRASIGMPLAGVVVASSTIGIVLVWLWREWAAC